MKGSEIREKFLRFFEEKNHIRVSSSALIPQGDKTLLFTNAGMNQFKSVFTGEETREYHRATSSQKCVRAGGKHNDLENVGITARHHTFFEMLGNFSFGDYFKEDAIAWAWEFLTGVCGLPKEKLWITVFRDDDQAAEIWERKIGIPEERIVRMGEKDNFWSMGDTGPCGPCSEIHIDQGQKVGCGRTDCNIHCGCDRFLEIWNLVFMQFDKKENGEMVSLPKPSIDTGMGLERIAAVVQGKKSNYETDLIFPLIQRIAHDSSAEYGTDQKLSTAMRVIADHIRSMTFLIADGVLPSNEGRGYVLRRILRRAKRYQEQLGLEGDYLFSLVPEVYEIMKEAYPELSEKLDLVSRVIRLEEEKFSQTLRKGRNIIEEMMTELKQRNETVLSGEDAFRLYDTYGFPLEMSKEIFLSEGFTIDENSFTDCMEKQKNLGQSSWKSSSEGQDSNWTDSFPETVFMGYETLETVSCLLEFDEDVLILDRSPFYAESGGQAGDTGIIKGNGFQLEITDTVKSGNVFLHRYNILNGKPYKGAEVTASVNAERRMAIRANHSATHILQASLREVLGNHVQQAGSLVKQDGFRFDFKHFAPLTEQEMLQIEKLANEKIWQMLPVTTRVMSMDEARKAGALAFFDEKYGQTVRVVSMGNFSTELCGGTHVSNTGEIGLLKLKSETGIAASMRRIEAVTRKDALQSLLASSEILHKVMEILKVQTENELPDKTVLLLKERRDLEKQLSEQKTKNAASDITSILENSRKIGDITVLTANFSGLEPQQLRSLADVILDKAGSGVVVLGSAVDSRVSLTVKVSKDLTSRIKAGDLIRKIAPFVDGSGGGKPDLAQAGGKNPAGIEKALSESLNLIRENA